MTSEKTNLLGKNLSELQELCAAEGFPRFTAKQICDWLYKKRVDTIDAMTNLSLAQRLRLNEIAYIGRHTPVDCQVSKDGTKKYLFWVGNYVESVYIPVPAENLARHGLATLCISCQAGCKMGCRFCETGKQGFHGSLTAADILNQIFSIPEADELTNIVYMGMGEPMDNLDAVLRSTEVLTAPWGLAWSPHRITVSTVGVIPRLKRFLDESQCHVAVSLHNAVAAERLGIMPMQKVYPIADVVALLRKYDWNGQRRLSFEYTMFRGLNDDLGHAAELVRLVRGLNCRVNLIRYHSGPSSSAGTMTFTTATPQTMNSFRDYLNAHGITCTIRASRGEDIMAACGLLAGRHASNVEAQ